MPHSSRCPEKPPSAVPDSGDVKNPWVAERSGTFNPNQAGREMPAEVPPGAVRKPRSENPPRKVVY